MNRLVAGRPLAIVLVPATFCAFLVCASGGPFGDVLVLLHAPMASSAVTATPSASARVFISSSYRFPDEMAQRRDVFQPPGPSVLRLEAKRRLTAQTPSPGR